MAKFFPWVWLALRKMVLSTSESLPRLRHYERHPTAFPVSKLLTHEIERHCNGLYTQCIWQKSLFILCSATAQLNTPCGAQANFTESSLGSVSVGSQALYGTPLLKLTYEHHRSRAATLA